MGVVFRVAYGFLFGFLFLILQSSSAIRTTNGVMDQKMRNLWNDPRSISATSMGMPREQNAARMKARAEKILFLAGSQKTAHQTRT